MGGGVAYAGWMNRSTNWRTHFTPEKRAALVREFRASGETQKGFAARHGVKWTTFRNWLYSRATGSHSTRPVRLQEISIGPLLASNAWAAEITLKDGTVVRLRAGTDPGWAQAIIQPLRQSC